MFVKKKISKLFYKVMFIQTKNLHKLMKWKILLYVCVHDDTKLYVWLCL